MVEWHGKRKKNKTLLFAKERNNKEPEHYWIELCEQSVPFCLEYQCKLVSIKVLR